MYTPKEISTMKMYFKEMTQTPGAGYKIIEAAEALRRLHQSLPAIEQLELIAWIESISDLDAFVSGSDKDYYVSIAVRQKGLRRANLQHLQRYSSDETGHLKAPNENDDEYTINIWKSEWRYIENFLAQFEIEYRILQPMPQ